MADNRKEYLGDGAYVEVSAELGEVVLTAENGISVTDRVVLDTYGLVALLNHLQSLGIIRWTKGGVTT